MEISEIAPYVRIMRTTVSTAPIQSYIDPEYVFTYIKEGEGIFILEGTEYRIKAGDMILMPPYLLHIIKPDPPYRLVQYVIHFDLFFRPERRGELSLEPEMTFQRFREKPGNPETLPVGIPFINARAADAKKREVCRLFEELQRQFSCREEFFELTARAKMLEILVIYLTRLSTPAASSTEHLRNWHNIEKAIAYIHEHYTGNISLVQVSRRAGVSPNYFCCLFRQYARTSVHQYINRLRLYKAKLLIAESQLNLTQIAEATGFGSIHTFSIVFKKSEGVSPSDYARSHPPRPF